MKRSELLFSAITVPLDYIALLAAAISAYFLRYISIVQDVRPVIFNLPFQQYLSISALVGLSWLVVFMLTGLYSMIGTKKFTEQVSKIFVACSAGMALVLAIMVFSRYLFDSRFIILATWILAFIYISIERLIVSFFQKQAFKLGIGVHRVIIIGNSQVAKNLTEEFNSNSSLGYKVVDQFIDYDQQTAQKLDEFIKEDKFDEIIQINPNLSEEKTNALIDFVNENHITFKYAADLLGTRLINLDVATISGIPIVEVKKTRLDGWGRIYKRVFDIVGSIILIIIFSPLMIITAIAIKLTSKGPILFKYKRIGQNGKPFDYFKFRSMVNDAHKLRYDNKFLSQHQNLREGTPMMKFENDPRITTVGKFIRRFSIDELPEFFNSLIGKMSLVGPRPHEIEEVNKYQKHHKKLLDIKPGITGLAQVSGRSDLNFEDEVKLDTYYIENWSLALDLQILLKTPLAVLKRRKAE